jgi:ribonuclease BN (tRNA processing enzyme)
VCEVVSTALKHVAMWPKLDRRRFLETAGLAAVAGGLAACGDSTAQGADAAPPPAERHRTEVVLLGTSGGPILLGGPRAGISTAVVYSDRVYVVDFGIGSYPRLGQAGLGLPDVFASSLSNVHAILFTHLHSDHFADWPAVYATGISNITNRTQPAIKVFGPGDRGTLPRVFPPGRTPPPVFSPEQPTPGIAGMTAHLRRAFAQDLNDRARDGSLRDPDDVFEIHELDLGGTWTVDADGKPPRLTTPLEVWVDGDVRITATLVDHHPMAPAFAYRFDTPDGSVVVSGDTTVSQNLIDLAQGCDYLVHEVIDARFVDAIVAAAPPEAADGLRAHLLGAHTTIEQVGRDVAEPAQAKNLVLTHLVPATSPESNWQLAQRGYSGRLIVGNDLMCLGVERS